MMNCDLKFIADSPFKNEIEIQEKQDHCCFDQLKCLIYENATILPSLDYTEDSILPGGVVDAHGDFIEESGYAEKMCCSYEYDDQLVKSEDATAIYIGFLLNCYGHGFTDNVKKIWALYLEKYQTQKYKVVYLTERNQPMPSWQKEIFRLAGVDTNTWIHVKTLTRYKRIIIPQDSIRCENTALSKYRTYTKEYRNVIDRIKQNFIIADAGFPEKIYFTRTAIDNHWRECGEERVEQKFRKHGYEIISPEKLTISQQIRLLMNCKFFASTEGSCSHNSIFCSPGTNVIVIRKADYCNSYQTMIDVFSKTNVTYIDAHHSTKNTKFPMQGPFYLYASRFLCKYFGDSFYPPHWLDILYWVYKKDKWPHYILLRKAIMKFGIKLPI